MLITVIRERLTAFEALRAGYWPLGSSGRPPLAQGRLPACIGDHVPLAIDCVSGDQARLPLPSPTSLDHHPVPLNGATAWSPGSDRDESTGFQVFASACASCHGWDGNGQQTDNAGLRGSRSVNDPAGTNVVRAVLEGIKIGSLGGHNMMPRFADAYSDEEIAAVSNYVIGHFGGKQGKVTAAEVRASRD